MPYKLDDIKILVVEDMLPMLTLTKSILQIYGFKKIYGAKNSDDAFEQFCYEEPDVILIDWSITPLDGMALTQKIRRDEKSVNPFVPIILLSGYTEKRFIENARDNGMTEFLMKPFTSRDMYKKIVQLIERPRQFVKASEYFGPDRRRKKGEYMGPIRRMKDLYDQQNKEMIGAAQSAAQSTQLKKEQGREQRE